MRLVQDIISLVAAEYTKLFAHNSKLTRDEKKAKLLHHLSVSGIYHSFKVTNSRAWMPCGVFKKP